MFSNLSVYRIFEGVAWGVSLATLVFAGLLFTTLENVHNGAGALVYVVVLAVIPRLVRWIFPRQSPLTQKHLIMLTQGLVLMNLILNGWGSLGWYGTSYNYDDIVHFMSPVGLVYVAAIWYQVYQRNKSTQVALQFPWVAMGFTAIISLIWEPTEYYGDRLVGSQTYGQIGQPLDTVYDLIADAFGILCGASLYWWTRHASLRWF